MYLLILPFHGKNKYYPEGGDMSSKNKKTDIIINSDGSIYHLKIKPGQIAENIILTGDPGRVSLISNYFDHIDWIIQNREITSHTGRVGNKKITVLSTGMGTDNIDIVINELDALVNIDFKTGEPKEKHTKLNLIRLGTSGAIQKEIPLNAFIISEYGLGLDGLMHFYDSDNCAIEEEGSAKFLNYSQWPSELPSPYLVKASDTLLDKFSDSLIHGITATAPGFYGPQGRTMRYRLAYPQLNNILSEFSYKNLQITNYEMETSALYGLSRLLNHNALTICIAIANRATGEYNANYKQYLSRLIEFALSQIVNKF